MGSGKFSKLGLLEESIINGMLLSVNDVPQIVKLLKAGEIVVMPTDTIYGIHCLPHYQDLIDKICEIKKRAKDMPLITLISNWAEIINFDVKLDDFEQDQIRNYWPGPNTLIFKTNHGTTKSFRLPESEFLISVLKKTGPLVSTSANLHGFPTAKSIAEAEQIFGDSIKYYVDGGFLNNPPSSIYRFENDQIAKLR